MCVRARACMCVCVCVYVCVCVCVCVGGTGGAGGLGNITDRLSNNKEKHVLENDHHLFSCFSYSTRLKTQSSEELKR